MVVEHAPQALPLLMEPEPPEEGRRFAGGYRRRNGELVRCYTDDAQGAVAQWAVVCHRLTRLSRTELAHIFGQNVSGGIALMIGGQQWATYTAPVMRALDRLGIRPSTGTWTGNEHSRPTEIAAACLSLLDQAADMLDGQPVSVGTRAQLVADMRLLTSVKALEPWRSRWPR